MKSAALVLLTTGMVLAASMVQTDWSGGPSGEVTTTDWGSDFGSCSGMGWQAQGALTLGAALESAKVSDNGDVPSQSTHTSMAMTYTDLLMCLRTVHLGVSISMVIRTCGQASSLVPPTAS